MEGGVAVVLISSAEMREVTRWEVQPSLDCPTTDRERCAALFSTQGKGEAIPTKASGSIKLYLQDC